ncbi:hypothetical protein PAMP_024097 [Pampus punctatissimus]
MMAMMLRRGSQVARINDADGGNERHVLYLRSCKDKEVCVDKWEDIKGAVASCQDHKGLQRLSAASED